MEYFFADYVVMIDETKGKFYRVVIPALVYGAESRKLKPKR